mmetsp:Transcript_55151/g.178754  ORF Transcript_55151/g.178754 Transcript_55151/m.178754 type:complete len:257 (+) Transcript_55151:351-1121(+)
MPGWQHPQNISARSLSVRERRESRSPSTPQSWLSAQVGEHMSAEASGIGTLLLGGAAGSGTHRRYDGRPNVNHAVPIRRQGISRDADGSVARWAGHPAGGVGEAHVPGPAAGQRAAVPRAARRRLGGSRSETITAKEWKAITLDAAGVLKPYLLWLVVSTSLGAGVLLNSAEDASRRFVMLITLFHIGPEMLLLTYLLLGVPPHGEDHRWKPRIAVRSLYWVCFLILVLAPLRREDDLVVGPLGAGVFVLMAARRA